MTVIVTDKCDGCRFTDCVTVCPVACFHTDGNMVYVNPAECIDCGACIPVCPVHAIYEARDLPAEFAHWKGLNAERAPGLPIIADKLEPLPTALGRQQALGYGA